MIIRQFRVRAVTPEEALQKAQNKTEKQGERISSCSTREVMPGWFEFVARCEAVYE